MGLRIGMIVHFFQIRGMVQWDKEQLKRNGMV